MGLLIYLIGILPAYFISRHFNRMIAREMRLSYSWIDVFFNLAYSSGSYFTVFALGLTFVIKTVIDKSINKSTESPSKEPPKWL